jgi:Fanconi-associated nuclease 1
VEEVALQHYRRQSWCGYHAETSVLTTIFSLLFWDIIFAPVPGVFQNRFQSAPLDLNTEFFYTQRSALIDARIEQIMGGEHVKILSETFQHYHEKRPLCVGVNWDYFSLQDLQDILEVC